MDEPVRNQGLANLFEWITNKTSEDCRKHFIAIVRCSLEKPSLLVMCNHASAMKLTLEKDAHFAILPLDYLDKF